MQEPVDALVLQFLEKELGVKSGTIHLNTDIGRMHAQGDDAEEMMRRFFNDFKITPGNFDLSRHFASEKPILWGSIRLRDLLRLRWPRREPLTPVDLIAAVKATRWCKY